FTPNGDGINEVFEMENDIFESFEIVIMNRWGNIVHRRTDATGTYLWDGLAQSGERVSDGVYFFRLTGTLTDGTLGEKHGNVTVIENQP
ncbi:MAG: gliding motility-associated C-terminal domain-containing protein, partial [Crocinitomicaceae bacterium]